MYRRRRASPPSGILPLFEGLVIYPRLGTYGGGSYHYQTGYIDPPYHCCSTAWYLRHTDPDYLAYIGRSRPRPLFPSKLILRDLIYY